MAQILSSDTIYSVAYLTEKGRELLFNQNNCRFITDPSGNQVDLFQITQFSLSDPDANYEVGSNALLQSGDIPDISGNNENCLKSAADMAEKNLISVDGVVNYVSDVYEYITSYSSTNNVLVINVNDSSIISPAILPVTGVPINNTCGIGTQ